MKVVGVWKTKQKKSLEDTWEYNECQENRQQI